MSSFCISLSAAQPKDNSGSVDLKIKVGDTVLTQLSRKHNPGPSDTVRCPSAPLAFWFADNWWRHRWESKPARLNPGWRMAHEMTAIGHGNAWPNLTLWGDRERVMLVSKADAAGLAGPVQFLTDAIAYVPASKFETTVDLMLETACETVPDEQRGALLGLLAALRDERADSEISAWRRLEAVNGYCPDQAPEILIEDLLTLEKRFLAADVEEAAAAAAGSQSAERLNAALVAAEDGAMVDFSHALGLAATHADATERLEPWVLAERSAEVLRNALGRGLSPLLQKGLSELLGMSAKHMAAQQTPQSAPYALRLAREGRAQIVVLTAKWAHDRRFQAARTLGDAIWSECSALGVLSTVGSVRQKFQRAFAAALLCPARGLLEFLDTDAPTDEDISEAARHFHVNEKTVRSVLVNKHIIERHRLGHPIVDPQDPLSLDTLVDAA